MLGSQPPLGGSWPTRLALDVVCHLDGEYWISLPLASGVNAVQKLSPHPAEPVDNAAWISETNVYGQRPNQEGF